MRIKENGNKNNSRYQSLKELREDICDLMNHEKPEHAYSSAKNSPGSTDRFILDVFRQYEKPQSGCMGCLKGCAVASVLGLAIGYGAYKLPNIKKEVDKAYKLIKPYVEEVKKIISE